MKTTDDCQIDDGFVNYLVFTYCNFELDLIWIPLIIIVIIIAFSILFLIICYWIGPYCVVVGSFVWLGEMFVITMNK